MSAQTEMATIFTTSAAHRPHGTVEPLDDQELILPDLLSQISICEEIGSVTADAPVTRASAAMPSRIPEQPYRHLIETEGFGMMAANVGVMAVAMPKLEIRHARV